MNKILTAEGILAAAWLRRRVTLQLRSRLVGGVPKSQEVIENWLKVVLSEPTRRIETLAGITAAAIGQSRPTVEEATAQTATAMADQMVEGLSECVWTGFKGGPLGLYIEGRQIKALLKEAANITKDLASMTAFKARVAERIFVVEEAVLLGRIAPDGWEERPIHIMTAQGPRSALKRFDYVERPTLTFTVKMLAEPFKTKDKDTLAPDEVLKLLLDLGQEIGLGADRSQGNGTFDIVSIE